MDKLELLKNSNYQIMFEKCPGKFLVLLPDEKFTIVAITDEYAKATNIKKTEAIGRSIFEVFSENPGEQQDIAVQSMLRSLNKVVQTKKIDKLDVHKYDIREPVELGGNFEDRYWLPVNSPVINEYGQVQYIIHLIEDVTEIVSLQSKGFLQIKLENNSFNEVRDNCINTILKLNFEKLREQSIYNSAFKKLEESSMSSLSGDANYKSREEILIINADKNLINVFEALFEPFFIVNIAYSQDEAFDILKSKNINLILCDMNSNNYKGVEILKFVRSKVEYNNILFLMLLDRLEDVLEFKLFKIGIQDFIVRPLSPEVILSKVQNLLALKKMQDLSCLDGVLENALDSVIGVDQFGYITHWNSQSEKIFGWSKQEALGYKMSEKIIPLRLRSKHREGFDRFIKRNKLEIINRRIELIGLRKDGSEFPLELSITPIRFKDSFIFYGFIRDITERVELFEQIQNAKDQADVANKIKSSFLANMSHEIRSPLTSILGFTDLLNDSTIDQKSKNNFIEAIKRNGEHLLNLINDILDLSKVESGKLNIDICECPLTKLLDEVISTLEIKAKAKGVELSVKYLDGLPKTIFTDELRLKQILFNIIENAIKFTEKGRVEIEVGCMQKSKLCSEIIFKVVDTGVGISECDREKLFLPFSQIEISKTRKFEGTGLGLNLSRNLAQLLGGDIVLRESKKGVGSTFEASIGSNISNAVKINSDFSSDQTLMKNLDNIPGGEERIDGVRILLTEDSIDNQILIQQILTKAGGLVEVAENGQKALSKSIQNNFDIYLIDLQMPVMDGFETLAELRKLNVRNPIIAITANVLPEEKANCISRGFSAHISKPINRKNLIETIIRYLKK